MILVTSEIDNIDDMVKNTNYKYIYISIGSKFNEPEVHLHNCTIPCNSTDQMYPRFMSDLEEKNLCIVIDEFNSNQLTKNKNQIQALQSDYTDVIIMNKHCNESFLISFLSQVIECIGNNNFPKDKFMIANYVRHLNEPNAIEQNSETIIPITIQTFLNTSEFVNYVECFYQWFGYRRHFYNYLYNYKNLTNFPNVANLMNQVENIIKNLDNIASVNQIVIQDNRIISVLDKIYNFCESNVHNKSKIQISKLEYAIGSNEIVTPD